MLSSETVILSIEDAPKNAVDEIEVQPLPINISFSDEQLKNVLSFNLVTLFGISILLSLVQLLNTLAFIVVRLSGRFILSSDVQSSKA